MQGLLRRGSAERNCAAGEILRGVESEIGFEIPHGLPGFNQALMSPS
jgi:hypothetical protein